jgi:hypothetical protein
MDAFVEIDTPHLLPQLRAKLEEAGCSTEAVGSRGCHVFHHEAADAEEALFELCFFVRAWARSHGDVAVRLGPDVR